MPTQAHIEKPANLSPQPDEATQKGLPDYTGDGSASERVLRINLFFFNAADYPDFNTPSKRQSALSLALLELTYRHF